MKKRIASLLLIAALCLSLCVFPALADDAPAPVQVNVSVSIDGALVLTNANVLVYDADEDGALTLNDAFICVHDQHYDGGADAGYKAVESDWGLSMAKLWGVENGGSYGYYVNDAMAFGLSDPVNENDYIAVWSYVDTEGFSDQYCFFETREIRSASKDVDVTLMGVGFDEDWNPVAVPVAGAAILVNGEPADAVTDENGKATVHFADSGEYELSAVSDEAVLVPPYGKVIVTAVPDDAEEPTLIAPAPTLESIAVNVSIACGGELVLPHAEVMVNDVDDDGALTINDAMICAHNRYFEGGAEAGYSVVESDYGLSVAKLWGVENGGSYGYYVNDAMAWGLSDPIQAKDCIVAWVYVDTENWSDQYTFFEAHKISTTDMDVTVTLLGIGFDEDWNTVTVPVAGAMVTVNGMPNVEGLLTDEEGKVTLRFSGAGVFELSATSENAILVPPYGKIGVNSFADTTKHWAEEEIETVISAGLMGDAGKGSFAPNDNLTRGQLVTVLYRMAEFPEAEGEMPFTDVKDTAFYADAVLWANANGIVNGRSANKFAPNDKVTRQELVTMLYRYAKFQGWDVSVGENTNILSYNDVFSVKEWAMSAMQWACGAGLVQGNKGDLDPNGNATRAQFAAILARLLG